MQKIVTFSIYYTILRSIVTVARAAVSDYQHDVECFTYPRATRYAIIFLLGHSLLKN